MFKQKVLCIALFTACACGHRSVQIPPQEQGVSQDAGVTMSNADQCERPATLVAWSETSQNKLNAYLKEYSSDLQRDFKGRLEPETLCALDATIRGRNVALYMTGVFALEWQKEIKWNSRKLKKIADIITNSTEKHLQLLLKSNPVHIEASAKILKDTVKTQELSILGSLAILRRI